MRTKKVRVTGKYLTHWINTKLFEIGLAPQYHCTGIKPVHKGRRGKVPGTTKLLIYIKSANGSNYNFIACYLTMAQLQSYLDYGSQLDLKFDWFNSMIRVELGIT